MDDSTLGESRFSRSRNNNSNNSLLSPPHRSDSFSPVRLQKSPLERIHQKEMHRITELWEDTKEELKKTGEEIREFEESQKIIFGRREREYLGEIEQLKREVDVLRERNHSNEIQLSKIRSEKASVELQLEEVEDKLKKTESLLEVRSSMLRSKQQQIQELNNQVSDINNEKEQVLNKSTNDLHSKQTQIKSAEIKLTVQESKIKQLEEDIKFLTKLNERNTSTINQLEELKEDQQSTIEEMRLELGSARDQLQVLKSRKRYKLDVENKLAQSMADNARLTKLLSTTGKFDDFVRYNQESDPLVYVQPENYVNDEDDDYSFSKSSSFSFKERAINPKSEWKYWVPQDAYDAAKSFQRKYLPAASDDLFSELLVRLNEIWHKRELKKINELKSQHTESLRDLRRQLSQRQHYEDVIQLDRIDYLKKELKKAQSPISKKMREVEGGVLDSTLVAVETLSKELASVKKANRDLKRMSIGRDGDTSFMEGAAWLGRKVVDLADKLGERISSLSLDYQQKVIMESSKSSSTPSGLIKTQGRFFRSLERHILNFREKLRKIFEKVLQAIEDGDDATTLKLSTIVEEEQDFEDIMY